MIGTRPGGISIILVQPKQPGNIGAAARAMKTMGLDPLVLVAPPEDVQAHPDALRMAHGAHDVLQAARIAPTLAEALAGTTLAISTTHRRRAGRARALSPAEAAERLVAALARPPSPAVARPSKRGAARAEDDAPRVALVFGREDRGLTTAELDLCAHTSRVPAVTRHPSLNLAQAVMVYAWEIRRATLAATPAATRATAVAMRRAAAPFQEIDALFAEMENRLADEGPGAGRLSGPSRAALLRSLRLFVGRAAPTSRETAVLRKLIRALDASG